MGHRIQLELQRKSNANAPQMLHVRKRHTSSKFFLQNSIQKKNPNKDETAKIEL